MFSLMDAQDRNGSGASLFMEGKLGRKVFRAEQEGRGTGKSFLTRETQQTRTPRPPEEAAQRGYNSCLIVSAKQAK
ncbi:hypothetical protein AV530_005081 [Patagioenas fasciata monilis]|uniref:Uncharacterized protein n=1 Tax=Patagioenas fasciata monilis TaxID=372326 RepID=A0A1V4K452_PATFA|nr:hypothetical protein AV530_005081 [Patagioenas fasciata monilis]